jgi:hypothetical protein
MPKRKSALSEFLSELKSETKAEKSASATLKKIIDDYCLSGEFDAYLVAHADDLAKYIGDNARARPQRHRASQIGKCAQQQAFKLAGIPKTPIRASRPATQMRALYNGTFVHIRYHMIFDALHAKGSVRTLYAEHLAVNEELSLSGTVDRVIEFEYLGKTIRVVVDYKSIKAFYFDHLIKPQPDHAKQQHAYELLRCFDAHLWMMLYENKDTHELKIYDMPYDELQLHKLIRTMKDVETYAQQAKEKVPMEERIDLPLTVAWCRYCEYEPSCELQHPNLIELQRAGDADEDADDE